MKISEVLIKARDIIQERGWCKGNWHGSNGEVCLETAIAAAVGEMIPPRVNYIPAGRVLAAYLGLGPVEYGPTCPCGCGIPMSGDTLANWNDAPSRTVEEVIEALEVCALIEAEKEAREPEQPERQVEVYIPPTTFTGYDMPKPMFYIPTTLTFEGTVVNEVLTPKKPDKELVSV